VVLRTVLFVAVAVDPFGAFVVLSRQRERRDAGAVAVIGAGVLLALACLLGPSLLDGLDISAEAAEIAAGIVLLVPALTLLAQGDQLLLLGDAAGGWRRGLVPLAVPLLAGPAPLLVVAALAARWGRGEVAAGVVVAVALAAVGAGVALRRSRVDVARSIGEGIAGRAVGAAMVLVGFTLIVDGVLGV
jgi:multiple antibiotic resistance protein